MVGVNKNKLMKKKLVVITGAGVSAESGVKTFRDSDGLWEGFNVMDVAHINGWNKNKELVLDFYNQRRAQLKDVHPNEAHKILAELQDIFDVNIITQNVDNLHERAGSSNILHLHGELTKARSFVDLNYVVDWEGDINLDDRDPNGHHMRPHIVWFGENVPMLSQAIKIVKEANIVVIIGTSMQVYPAASIIDYVGFSVPIYYIDPKPAVIDSDLNVIFIKNKAIKGMQKLKNILKLHENK